MEFIRSWLSIEPFFAGLAGTFHNGESRYLFSSAQIDYLRYWLFAMKLTSQVIPLPSSNHLFTHSELSSVSPAVHPSLKYLTTEMKLITGNGLKRIKKINSRVSGCPPSLISRRNTFERVRNLWAARTGVWCALDFETWTGDFTHGIITEFGYSRIHWDAHGEEERGIQDISREHYNPEFGVSVEVTKAEFKKTVCDLISGMNARGPVFLVFHDPREDINGGTFIVDTAVLWGALRGRTENESLQRVCKVLQIHTEYLHNAGNDAHYTLDALREMASGEPLDAQAERRWPKWSAEPGDTTGFVIHLPPPAEFESESE
ncbi:putative nucleolar protein C2C4.08 [Mycena venus]|uniref:Putative nucleolar protein C2C4.08 n=1 Tax=Mycena venus TaxID=2733690 RepID=A0A8H6TYY7_9AGAR|nr:putative nucleolar protein C2C4.08 [Mycena venus]